MQPLDSLPDRPDEKRIGLSPFFVSDALIDPDAFLRQEVESASPAKLRWLLLRKAIGLCQAVEQLWSDARFGEADQWLLRVRDIFGELLAGVTDPKNPAAESVADLYTFLLLMLENLEKGRDRVELRAMISILDVELGTWDLFVRREGQIHGAGVQFDGPSRLEPHAGPGAFSVTTEWAGLNVEA